MGKRKIIEIDENNNEAIDSKIKRTKSPSSVLTEIDSNKLQTSSLATSSKKDTQVSDQKEDEEEKSDESDNEEDKSDKSGNEEDEEPNQERTYVCRCGYDPKKTDPESNLEKCSINVALQNHVVFPSFKLLNNAEEPSALYYNLNKHVPNKHWALLLDIEKFEKSKTKFSLIGTTIFDEEVKVDFSHADAKEPNTFLWSDMKKGNSIAILYAEKKSNLNNSKEKFVEVNDLDACFVFNMNLNELFRFSSQILENADLKCQEENPICFQCESQISDEQDELSFEKKNPQNCNKCKFLFICSKNCKQYLEREKPHKDVCSQFSTMLNLASLPRKPSPSTTGFFTFYDNKPVYEFKEKFIQIFTFPTPGNKINRQCGLCWRNFRDCWIDKRCSLTQTECCKKWICDDEDSRDMRNFSSSCHNEPSCFKSHRKYSMCNYHFVEGHKGKWNNCAQCRNDQSDYDESIKEWHNFGVNPKPKNQYVLGPTLTSNYSWMK